MVRINLLPREITERRKFERLFGYAAVAGLIVLVALGFAYAVASFMAAQRGAELQEREQMANQLRTQADAFAIFERREAELRAREEIAGRALDGRINWARLMTEISLVMPSDVWAEQIGGSEDTGMSLRLSAVDSPADTPDYGHKAVAKTLVRLADLEQLIDVWLTGSRKATISDGDDERPIVSFDITTGIVKPATSQQDDPGVPAPPEEPTGP